MFPFTIRLIDCCKRSNVHTCESGFFFSLLLLLLNGLCVFLYLPCCVFFSLIFHSYSHRYGPFCLESKYVPIFSTKIARVNLNAHSYFTPINDEQMFQFIDTKPLNQKADLIWYERVNRFQIHNNQCLCLITFIDDK